MMVGTLGGEFPVGCVFILAHPPWWAGRKPEKHAMRSFIFAGDFTITGPAAVLRQL
jgi:hypothetical protein